MKRFLILVLVLACAPLWADGGWDLTKPANTGYVASFPAEVRANQTAIVASLTPPIEWTGDETDYGTPSAKLGYTATFSGEDLPAFWLGSIGSGTFYSFGPRDSFSDAISTTEWGVLVASYSAGDQYLQLLTPKGPGGVLGLYSAYFGIGDRRLASVATGTDVQDAVNLGQMNAAVAAASVLVIANMQDGGSYNDHVITISNGGGVQLASFPHEIADTHGALGGATFTAPLDGVYEIGVQMLPWTAAAAEGQQAEVWISAYKDNSLSEVLYPGTVLARNEIASPVADIASTLSGRVFVPMSANDTFVLNLNAVATDFRYYPSQSQLYIRKIADLP